MDHPRREILCIDDDEQTLRVRTIVLEALGYQVWAEPDAKRGLHAFEQHDIDAVVMDYQMPGMNGGEAAVAMKRLRPHVPVMIISALPRLPEGAPAAAIDQFVQKGEPLMLLAKRIEEMIASRGPAPVLLGPAGKLGSAVGSALGQVAARLRPLKKAMVHKRLEGPIPCPPQPRADALRPRSVRHPERRYK